MTGPYYDPKRPIPAFDTTTEWLRGEGEHFDVVLSSRVRLARNLAGVPFAAKASKRDRLATLDACRNQILRASISERIVWVDLHDAPLLDRPSSSSGTSSPSSTARASPAAAPPAKTPAPSPSPSPTNDSPS